MNRMTALWTIVLFFGASLLFGTLRRATEGESAGLTIGVQVGALAIVIAIVVIFYRQRMR